MGRNHQPAMNHSEATPSPPTRRPYHPPRVLSAERLEVFAVVCGPPGKADFGACPSGPINS